MVNIATAPLDHRRYEVADNMKTATDIPGHEAFKILRRHFPPTGEDVLAPFGYPRNAYLLSHSLSD